MTAFTVADHLADRLAELSGDNVFGASVDHRQSALNLREVLTVRARECLGQGAERFREGIICQVCAADPAAASVLRRHLSSGSA